MSGLALVTVCGGLWTVPVSVFITLTPISESFHQSWKQAYLPPEISCWPIYFAVLMPFLQPFFLKSILVLYPLILLLIYNLLVYILHLYAFENLFNCDLSPLAIYV